MLRHIRALVLLVVLTLCVSGHQTLSASSTSGWQPNHRSPASAALQEGEAPYLPNRLLVKFAPGTPEEEKAALHERLGAEVIEEIPDLGVQILRVSEDATSMVFAYQAEPVVAYAEPDYIVRIAGSPDPPAPPVDGLSVPLDASSLARVPNDPRYPEMWNLKKIRMEEAWDITTGSPEVVIAVIDTGADPDHPDLQGKLVPAYDFANGDADPSDDQGHGTHVSGTAGAATDNGIGIAGIGWNVKIMPVKALSSNGSGAHSWIANAITWAVDHGANVINMSLGGPYTSATMREAVNYAWDHGLVVVAAAGNAGSSNPTYPAAYENVMGVAATTENDEHASWSNFGNYVSVAAPGVAILSSTRGGGYAAWSGTSMATPHVSALAALLKSLHPDWTNTQIRETIESTAVDLGLPGWDTIYGYGRIDVYAALSSGSPPTSTPTPSVTPTPGRTSTPPSDLEQQLIDFINEERARLGLPPLRRDERLMAAARRHSTDMSNSGNCSHIGSDDSDPFDRILESGYPMASGSEVIACWYQTANDTFLGWQDSPSHRAILINENYTDIGCGVAETTDGIRYWTCNLARPTGPDLRPTATPTSTRSATPRPSATPTATRTAGPPPPRNHKVLLPFVAYYAGIEPVLPTTTPTHTPVAPTITSTPSPTPTRTPSPTPEDEQSPRTVDIAPQAQTVGWVVSNETTSNHFGDDDIYSGIHGGQVYIGAIQFDLSGIPAGAKINWARLTITGQTRDFVGDRGSWSVSLLKPDVDPDWPDHSYLKIRDAQQDYLILPILSNADLQPGMENIFNLDNSVLRALESRLETTQRASFRVDGPVSGANNLFSWDSGFGEGGLGKPPLLTINFTPGGEDRSPTSTPTPSQTPEPGPSATSTPMPSQTPGPGPSITPTPTSSQTPGPDPSATSTPPVSPTHTATATPTGETIITEDLIPQENSVGWVASYQPNSNNFGDDDIYSGIYTGDVHLGAIQFTLSSLPADAEVLAAELRLTGQTRQYLSGEGTWQVEMLSSEIDAGWPTYGYTAIDHATAAGVLQDLDENDFNLDPDQLDVERVNRLGLTSSLLAELNSRRRTTGYVSFRLVGPDSGTSNVFSWDSGYGAGSIGKPPVLRVTYRATSAPGSSPTPAPSTTPTPPSGGSDVDPLIRAINGERANSGFAALSVNAQLMQAAEAHSIDLATNNRWSHVGSDGSTPEERIVRAGYPLGEGAEVLAANTTAISAILAAWLDNPTHQAILMSTEYVDIGAAHAFNANSEFRDYWTVVVAYPSESAAAR